MASKPHRKRSTKIKTNKRTKNTKWNEPIITQILQFQMTISTQTFKRNQIKMHIITLFGESV